MSGVIEKLTQALAARKHELDLCPANKRHLGDTPCPKCGASTAGPCWLGVAADATVVDVVKEIVAEQAIDTMLAADPGLPPGPPDPPRPPAWRVA